MTLEPTVDRERSVEDGGFQIRLPTVGERHDQDTEYCHVLVDGSWRRLRFHDYAEIFALPGLYEQLFHGLLECRSPTVVSALLGQAREGDETELRVLDLGAGNGLVAEQLVGLEPRTIVGIDILPEAAAAAKRDRPEVYDDYRVIDMMDIDGGDRQALADMEFNALTCVAALGFDDIPPAAFRNAFNLVDDGGLVVFTLRDKFVSDTDPSGFRVLIDHACQSGALEIVASERYRHRLAIDGSALWYVATVGRKIRDLSE
ncbi:class I SAM-dependent DNA methyltransferase [Kutzneria sp. CA-103260]|uniref:class I SAM-dependent DNA methyltransferase n=1 Tax=Kutzneria sp. CA-103260 TaxID=2802641 RepID=UPI001BAC6E2C|nr:methyltransferase domain-containing protein [Kutzneria sp. CA-103260]QUQ64640.1 Ubiquinone biosynthesis O-methyltransferase, mitochondrial [Kutzneria sp. CA-103260]